MKPPYPIPPSPEAPDEFWMKYYDEAISCGSPMIVVKGNGMFSNKTAPVNIEGTSNWGVVLGLILALLFGGYVGRTFL